MEIKDLLKMDMDSSIQWLIDNENSFALVQKTPTLETEDKLIDTQMELRMSRESTRTHGYVVRVIKMKESHRETYWVTLDRGDRPKDARPWDGGRITPFMHENEEYANSEATRWAKFLGVEVAI